MNIFLASDRDYVRFSPYRLGIINRLLYPVKVYPIVAYVQLRRGPVQSIDDSEKRRETHFFLGGGFVCQQTLSCRHAFCGMFLPYAVHRQLFSLKQITAQWQPSSKNSVRSSAEKKTAEAAPSSRLPAPSDAQHHQQLIRARKIGCGGNAATSTLPTATWFS